MVDYINQICFERILEGSSDSGSSWSELDARNAEVFSRRFERRTFEIATEKRFACNALRYHYDIFDTSWYLLNRFAKLKTQ